MNPIPRPNRTDQIPATTLERVMELSAPPSTPRGVVDLMLSAAGLTIVPVGDQMGEIPTLVAWPNLNGFAADKVHMGADGDGGQVLDVVAEGPIFSGGNRVRSFVVPAPELAAFFTSLEEYAGVWASQRRRTAVRPGLRATTERKAQAAWSIVSVASAATARRLSRWIGLDSVPAHGQGSRRVAPLLTAMVAVVLVAGGATASVSATPKAIRHHRTPIATRFPITGNEVQATAAPKTPSLPAASAAPAPAPPSLAGSPPLQSHEIFGYAPYWTLPESPGFDVKNLTTLAYFSVDANGNGTLAQSGPGWNGYESQDLANLVTRAHAAGDRVVLTVTCFSQNALDQITSDPSAPARLSASLIAAVSAKNLDGVNFDFEGQGSADRTGLTALITQASGALHAANPHWQVTMATYASAAADSAGFYDVAALAPALDGFFVMAYDMNDPVTPSATAPLVGGGYNDTEALQQFTAVMPASKVILGVPYYGYDWPTTDGTQSAQSAGPETPLSYGVIAAAGNPTYWDPATETSWTSYQVGSQWHETYFDDPTSLALKAQLANTFHIRGLGIWALGMDGNDPAMLAALLGSAPAVKDYAPGPTSTTSSGSSTSTTIPPGTGYSSTGVWNGQTVDLNPISSQTGGTFIGLLQGFQTSDPSLTCLESGAPLDVWSVPALPGTYVATAVQPGNCATGTWAFFPSSGGGGGGSSTTTTTAPTTTTTTAPSSTTTTTAPPSSTTTTTAPPSSTTTTTSGGSLQASPSIPGLVPSG